MSASKLRFLAGENVNRRLGKFLKSEGFDAITAPKGVSNGRLAALSKSEKRILVANDSDFSGFMVSVEVVFSVVLLKIPRNKPESLLKSFSLLLKLKPGEFEGKLFVLEEGKLETENLGTPVKK